jgi:cobalt-zinc-cadmium efflux system outer membrane protein
MHRYRSMRFILPATALWLAGCALPSSRENAAAMTGLVAKQTSASLQWRRDAEADAAARTAADALLNDGLTVDEAVSVAFLLNAELQVYFEQLEISRSQFVAAATLPNPVAIVGVREPGGSLSAFYPGRNVTVGVLQNVIGLLNLPDRRRIARRDLERARLEAASRVTLFGAQVAQAWLEYHAARRIEELRGRSQAIVQTALDNLQASHARSAEGNPATAAARAAQLAQQRASLFRYRNQVLRAGVDTATAREKLAQLLGVSGWRDNWSIAGEPPALPSADIDARVLETAGVEKRLDVMAAAGAVDMRLAILAMQRRFRWLNQLDLGLFRDKAIGGTAFSGPNAVVEIPLFDQRQAQLLAADAELRSALRNLEVARSRARADIRTHEQEMRFTRALLESYDGAIIPNQQAMALGLGSPGNPDDPERLALRLTMLGSQEEQVGLLRDYWRARSALALSLGDWPAAQLLR